MKTIYLEEINKGIKLAQQIINDLHKIMNDDPYKPSYNVRFAKNIHSSEEYINAIKILNIITPRPSIEYVNGASVDKIEFYFH